MAERRSEEYIRQVKRALRCPRAQKREIEQDLREALRSAVENGEDEAATLARFGPADEFARAAGGGKPLRGKGFLLTGTLLLAAGTGGTAAWFSRPWQAPGDAIGQADAATGIQVVSGLAVHGPSLLLGGSGVLILLALGCFFMAWRRGREEQ